MENDKKLAESLKINSPTFHSLSDSVLNISRFNAVDMKWSDVLEDISIQEYLRTYFLSHSFVEVNRQTLLGACEGEEKFWNYFPGKVRVKELVLTGQMIEGEPEEVLVSKEVVKDLFCITLQHPRRLYVVGGKGKYLEKSDIEPFLEKSIGDLWEEFTEKDYDFFLTYFDSKANILDFDKNPRKDLVSRELLFYNEKFGHLSAKLKFIQQVNEKINTEFTSAILADQANLLKLFGDSELLSFYLSNYSRINLIEIELKKEIDIIQNKLFEKGYFLETEFSKDGIQRTKWDRTFQSKYGEIYSLVDVVVDREIEIEVDKEIDVPIYGGGVSGEVHFSDGSWRDRNGRRRIANGEHEIRMIGTKKAVVKEKIKKLVPKADKDIVAVKINSEPVYEKLLSLKNEGYWVHVFDNYDGSYFSYNDSPLSEVIESCENSEETRINTVIVIQDYDLIDSTNKAVVGATFYFHPMRSVIPSKLPTIGIRETLDYRMSWSGLEVGKLIDSICLAPGETKTVTISNKFSSVNSTTASTKTFNETSSVESREFSTEFEKLVTNELERVRESSSSLSAGASYGGMANASGEVRQSNKETLKDFTKNLNKSTNKATNTLSKKASVEVSFSSTSSVENASTSTRNSTISNINQGRTLNLYYYQLNNRFISRVYLENLRLEISSSLELIEGSGIYDKFVTKFSNIEKILSLTKQCIPHLKTGVANENLSKIVKSVIGTLNEYTDKPLFAGGEDEMAVAKLNSIGVINIPNQFAEKFNEILSYEQLIEAYKMLASSIQYEDLYFNEERYIVDSGSCYLDSQVGANPATEEYSETMRKLESFKIETEIEKQKSLNDEIRAKTRLLNSGHTFITEITNFSEYGNIADESSRDLHFSLLNLSAEITEDEWNVYVSNSRVVDCTVHRNEDGRSIVISWHTVPPAQMELKRSLILINDDKVLKYI